jgi:carboxyl-terminal processing protease
LKTVESKVIDQNVGYIRVTKFHKNTVPDVEKAIQDMKKNSPTLKGLVIDLRNNPGGDVQASVELAKVFLDSGIIASFEGNFPGYNVKFRADKGSSYDGPVVILVDEGSASASELFSGALQVNKRARLVGKKTYGKTACQTFVPISDEAGLYLTVGRFFLPDGSTIEGTGLVPDVIINDNMKEEEVLGRAIQLLKR